VKVRYFLDHNKPLKQNHKKFQKDYQENYQFYRVFTHSAAQVVTFTLQHSLMLSSWAPVNKAFQI